MIRLCQAGNLAETGGKSSILLTRLLLVAVSTLASAAAAFKNGLSSQFENDSSAIHYETQVDEHGCDSAPDSHLEHTRASSEDDKIIGGLEIDDGDGASRQGSVSASSVAQATFNRVGRALLVGWLDNSFVDGCVLCVERNLHCEIVFFLLTLCTG